MTATVQQTAAPPKPEPHEWFHSHSFADGETISGIKPEVVLQAEADAIFKHGVVGKSVLDVGAWDGFQSFQAEARGASRVLATDHFCWNAGPGWADKRGFDYAKWRKGSKVEELEIDVPNISPETVGMFDVVLFLGVLYHVKDPYRCLEAVTSVAKEQIIMETETAFDILPWPVMRLYKSKELNNDPTNFWAPNRACIKEMLFQLGFPRCEIAWHPHVRPHLRDTDLYWKRGRVIVHAWR